MQKFSSFYTRKGLKFNFFFLKCMDCNGLAYCIYGVVGRLLERNQKKKNGVLKIFFFLVLQCVKQEKIIIK